ncbi:hypothetical protein [Halocalculus aciditolerans]|uniref:Uncharacterized protein n=1 Tax=Halocalculus aciditolerans TaxID=1383812 RepID=A0A830FMN7_9EURY|nr:hypothetical protein [Halocalculus aciditolerans]GGL70915.1 hypothetical protein GCM10009039_31250 [Halocalculus aciditolerans]
MASHKLLVVAVAVVALALAPGSAAADCSVGTVEEGDISAFASAYNANTDELPGFLADRLADERVAVTVTGTDIVYTATTDGNAKVTSVEEGSVEPTLRVTTSEATLCEAVNSEDATRSLLAAYDDGEIEVSGVGTVKGTAVEVGEFAYGVGKTLGLW